MVSNNALAKRIVEIALIGNTSNEQNIKTIENLISWHIDDALKLIKNINQTSYGEKDRIERIIDLEARYGIPKTHLL